MSFKKIINLVIFATVFIAASASAASCIQYANRLSGIVGLDGPNGVIFANLTSAQNECACTHARFQPANTDVKMALSILMSAKLSDRTVRVDFLDVNSCDSAYRVYVY